MPSAAALRSFPGLAHRMQQVGRMGTIPVVNDSKATNADAAEKARKEGLANFELMVSADPEAFPTAGSYVPPSMPETDRKAALQQAETIDANRPAKELQAALDSETADDYVAKMVAPAKWEKDKWVPKTQQEIAEEIAKIPESVKKKRRKAWRHARKTGMGGATAPTDAAAASETPEAREVRLQLEAARSKASRLAE